MMNTAVMQLKLIHYGSLYSDSDAAVTDGILLEIQLHINA